MDYTPEQLRKRAARYQRGEGFPEDNRNEAADQLRAHADKIEECERLREALLRAEKEIRANYECHCDRDGQGPQDLMYEINAALKESK